MVKLHVLVLAFLCGARASLASTPDDLSAVLEPLRLEYHIPACACAVIKNGQIVAEGCTGIRKAASGQPVTTTDVWQIGSCTKSMTAQLIGMLVDDGKLRWDLSVAEALEDQEADPAWSRVTVWDLVTHQSGLGLAASANWNDNPDARAPRDRRATFARQVLARPPHNPPGTFEYSNAGYGLLGAIIEHVAGQSYEEMLRQRLFTQLDLPSAGFGWPAKPGKVDQPWGHRRRGETRYVPVEPKPENEFPFTLAPAACVHLTLQDFARYAAWLSTNDPPLLRPETAARLKTPDEFSDYAGGLWKTELPGQPGVSALCHTGNVGGFFAVFYTSAETVCVTVFNLNGGGWEWVGDVFTEAALKATAGKE